MRSESYVGKKRIKRPPRRTLSSRLRPALALQLSPMPSVPSASSFSSASPARTRPRDRRHFPPHAAGRLHSFWPQYPVARAAAEAHRRSARAERGRADHHHRPGRRARFAAEAHRQRAAECQPASRPRRPRADPPPRRITARLLRIFGFNLDLCPVLDISFDDEADNSLRGRCYGNDVAQVIRNAGAFNDGLRGGGVLSCGKHFPGYSCATIDAHHELPRSPAPAPNSRRTSSPSSAISRRASIR